MNDGLFAVRSISYQLILSGGGYDFATGSSSIVLGRKGLGNDKRHLKRCSTPEQIFADESGNSVILPLRSSPIMGRRER